jgi:hypothetical protein
MTLATICINVAQDLGIDEPAPPIFGSQLPAAKRLVAQARRTLWSLVRRADFAPLVIEHEFTANGSSDYALPPDFLSVVNDTVWERSRYWMMRGSLSPQQWQRYRSSIYGRATIWRRWRIRVASGAAVGTPTTFSIDPMVAASDQTSQFVFEYRSFWAVQHADGTMGPDWISDDDACPIFSNQLIELGVRWRMMRRLGLAYDEEKEEYDREVDKLVARSGGMATLQLVPFYREDFIGQYSLGAFPPSPPAAGAPLPLDIARVIAPMERPDWRPPQDWSGPPPLAPRPPPAPAPSAAERVLARLPPAEPPRPPVRRLRRRHQPPPGPPGPPPLAPAVRAERAERAETVISAPAPLEAAVVPPPPASGTAHPAEAKAKPERQGWLPLDGGAPLRPTLPALPLPPGT